jgi:hypothetical protein
MRPNTFLTIRLSHILNNFGDLFRIGELTKRIGKKL